MPGEPVHVAVAVTTETADPSGRLTVRIDCPHPRGGRGLVIVFGAVSGTTIIQDRS